MARHVAQSPAFDMPAAMIDARFRRPLMAFFGRRVSARAEAEDLTQEVFVRLLRHEDAICAVTAESYVFRIATNLLRDRARRARARGEARHSSLDAAQPDAIFPPALIEDRHPDRVLTGQEELRSAIAALDQLGDKTRDVFLLFRVEKMRQRDIASLYGMSVSAVEKHVVKAAVHLARHCDRS